MSKEELNYLYALYIIRLIQSRLTREMKNAYNIFVKKREPKTPLGKFRHIWEDNITACLKEILYKGVDQIYLVQDRNHWQVLVNTIRNILSSIKDGNLLIG